MAKKKPATKSSTKGPPTKTLKTKPPSGRPKKLPYKGWRLEHGISQSMLQKFIVDRDRFHMRVVRGLKPTDRKEAMEYGSIFHKLIEEGARMGDSFTMLKLRGLMTQHAIHNKFDDKSRLLLNIALVQYEVYHKWQSNLPKYKYIAQEPVFEEKYKLPATTWSPTPEIYISIPATDIIMRGRIDEVIEMNGGIYIQENKTKSKIDLQHISDTVPENLQVMYYAVAAALKYKRPIKGFIYNIIRKPGQRIKVKESEPQYITRIKEEIEANPSYYFYRLAYNFPPGAIARWEREELIPLLYQVYIWWRSIEQNPINPWEDEEGNPNPFHGRKPFGVYDPMVLGKGDYFELVVHGSLEGLIEDYQQFAELVDDDPPE